MEVHIIIIIIMVCFFFKKEKFFFVNQKDESHIDLKAIIPTKPPPPEPPKRTLSSSRRRKHLHRKKRRNAHQPIILNKCLQCAKNYVLPIVVNVIAFIGYLVGAALLVPNAYPSEDYFILHLLNQMVALFEVGMTLTNYFQCLRTSPGYVVPDWENTMCYSTQDRVELLELEPQKNGEPRYCHKCGLYQPPRAHHSSVHNKCVLKMDHYCIWVNNCVGLKNHKFFYLFLFYMVMGLIHYFITTIICVIRFARNLDGVPPLTFIAIIMCSVFLLPISCMIFMFFGWNTYLLITNQTSIESHMNGDIKNDLHRQKKQTKYHNPYELSVIHNISAVLGKNKFTWFIPVLPDVGDGIHYETISRDLILAQQKDVLEVMRKPYNSSSSSDDDDDDDDDDQDYDTDSDHEQGFNV
jgi:hypothetical protein